MFLCALFTLSFSYYPSNSGAAFPIGCPGSNLQEVAINPTTTNIPARAFANCPAITRLLTDECVELRYIPESFCENCTGLISLDLGRNIDTIGIAAFKGCYNLRWIQFEFDSDHAAIQRQAFMSTAVEEIRLPPKLTIINSETFRNCTQLHTISFSSSIAQVDTYAFADCISLISVSFVNGTSTSEIGDGAFSNTSIVSFTLPRTITILDQYLFRNCVNLTSLICLGSLIEIEDGVFSGCTNFRSLTMIGSTRNMARVGKFAFEGTSLLTFTFPNWMQHIEYRTFAGSNLTRFTIPDSVQVIEGEAFLNCTNLQNITISENSTLHTIGFAAFSGTSIRSIFLPSRVEEINQWGFSNIQNHFIITFHDGSRIRVLWDHSFQGSQIISFSIPDSVDSIDDQAFYDCTELQSVEFGENSLLSYIGREAFGNCRSLKSIKLPQHVEYIRKGTFSGSSSLQTVTFTAKSVEVDDYAFENCQSLSTINSPSCDILELENVGHKYSCEGSSSGSLGGGVIAIIVIFAIVGVAGIGYGTFIFIKKRRVGQHNSVAFQPIADDAN